MLGIKYDIKYLLLTLVLGAIFVTAVTTILYWNHMDKVNKNLVMTAGEYQLKTDLALKLLNAARDRESIFQNMLIVSDPFELDKLRLQQQALGGDFIKIHKRLKSMELSDREKRYIAELDELIRSGSGTQNRIRQLVMDGDVHHARAINMKPAFNKIRAEIFQQLEKLFHYYREQTHKVLQMAYNTVLGDIRVVLVVSTIILMLSAIVGFFMIRGIRHSEGKLKSEIALRVKSQTELEAHRNKLKIDIEKAIEKYKATEQKRVSSQEMAVSLGRILENSLNEIYIFDVNTLMFIQVNEGGRKNLGYTMDELSKLTAVSIKPDITEEKFRIIINSLLDQTQEKLTFTTRHQRKDGSCYPVEVYLQLSLMGCKPVFVAMILDITHRQEWQNKLQNKKDEVEKVTHELAFQKIALEEHAIVCVLNQSEIIQSVNRKYVDISGFTEEELVGAHFLVGLSGEQSEESVIDISAMIGRGDIWRGVISFLRSDGTPYWTKTTITPFFNKNDVIYKYVIVSTDITEQKITEEKLLVSNLKIHQAHKELSFQQQALDEHAIVSTADVRRVITYVNDKFCEISQYDRDELIGNSHSILKSDIHPDEFYRNLWRTIASGRVWKGNMCNRKKDGTFYWVAATIVPFLNDEGKPYKYIAMSVDITTQKKNEQQLIARNKEIKQTHKELEASQNMMLHTEKLASVGQLAAGIAHEINTPIQFVGDNTRFLQESFCDLMRLVEAYEELGKAANEGKALPELIDRAQALSEEVEVDYLAEEVPSAINQSLEGVERISKIVRSMKDFSHPGTDHLENIDLNNSIESTINVSRNEWKYVAEMNIEFASDLSLVPCYPGELNQVILNIIVNAAHAIEDSREYNDPLGTITISTKLINEEVEIRITDSGSGMPEEVKKRIFEPFFTTKGVGKGTGQGLAIAYAVIVDKHKGRVTVDSELGKGTTFIIYLPMNASVAGAKTEVEAPGLQSEMKGVA